MGRSRDDWGQSEGPMLIVSAIIGVILLGYLLYALVKPEKLG